MITVVSAGTADYRPMMEENRRRCEALGYRYVAHDLDLSSDLQGALPPCTFKPELMLRELRAIQPKHQPFEHTPEIIAWMDADAILVRDLSPLESINFDVAVTLRPAEEIGTTQPTSNYLNAGVIFFRPGGAACQFAADWATLTAKVRNDQSRAQSDGGREVDLTTCGAMRTTCRLMPRMFRFVSCAHRSTISARGTRARPPTAACCTSSTDGASCAGRSGGNRR